MNKNGFDSPEKRIENFRRTVEEMSTDIDTDSIVRTVIDQYAQAQLAEAALDPSLLNTESASLARIVSYQLTPQYWRVLSDVASVLLPLTIASALTFVGTRFWFRQALPIEWLYVIVSLPAAIGIFLAVGWIKNRKEGMGQLGILKNSVAGFVAQNSIGSAMASFIITTLVCGLIVFDRDQSRRRQDASLTSARLYLVDKSLSTIRELQYQTPYPIDPAPVEVKLALSERDDLFLKTERQSKSDSVRHTIASHSAFPGELIADLKASAGTVYWKKDDETIAESQIYLASIKDISNDTVVIETLQRTNRLGALEPDLSDNPFPPPGSNMAAQGINNTVALGRLKVNLLVNGKIAQLHIGGLLADVIIQQGDRVLLVVDQNSQTATNIEVLEVNSEQRKRRETK